MRQLFVVAFVLVALVACGQTQTKAPEAPAAIEPFDLNIEIGRYGAMLSTVENLTAERPESANAEVTEPREMTRQLREHVWQYNTLRSQLCARNIQAEASCGAAYNPVWLADPADAAVSLQEIRTRNEALGEEVMRLWDSICEEARAGVPEDEKMAVCPME